LESEIAKLTGKAPAALAPIRRKRTSSEDVKAGILKVLAATPTGLSQKEISEASGLSYNTVMLFLKKNSKDFKTTGLLRAKRYFLK
jgi:transcriptional regulator with XRE-family HTH domain